jgi:HK97 family phage portal protein
VMKLPSVGTVAGTLRDVMVAYRMVRRSRREMYIEALNQSNEAQIWPDLSLYTEQARQYARSSWFQAAVSRIARTAATVQLNVRRVKGEEETDIIDHPLERLLRQPNPDQSRFEFMEATWGFREIAGNVYWFLAGQPGGVPEELWILRPDRVRVVPGRDSRQRIAGYVYTVDGIEVPFDAAEVIHFKLFHPSNDLYGLSRAEAIALTLLGDQAATRFNYAYFGRNRAIPAGIVSVKPTITQDQFEQLKRDWREGMGSGQRRTAFIRGGDITYIQTEQSHEDMQFIEGRRFNREEVLILMGLHPGMYDTSATEANARVGYEIFIRDTMWPALLEFAQKLTVSLAPFWGRNLIVEPEDIRIKDKQAELREIETAGSYLTVNEIRKKYYRADPLPESVFDRPLNAPALAAPAPSPGSQPGQDPEGNKDRSDPAQPHEELEGSDSATKALMLAVNARTRDELRRFVTRFSKPQYFGQPGEISRFVFNDTPAPVAFAARAWADVAEDSHALALVAVKAVPIESGRVSINGVPDPDGRDKDRAANRLANSLAPVFERAASEVARGIRHVARTRGELEHDATPYLEYLSAGFWRPLRQELQETVQPQAFDIYSAAARSTLQTLRLRYGWPEGGTEIGPSAAEYMNSTLPDRLDDIMHTTIQGTEALINRSVLEPGATRAMLLAALDESPLFSAARARLIAGDLVSLAWAAGSWRGANGVAIPLPSPLRVSPYTVDRLFPAHAGCQCFVIWETVFEGERAVGIDGRWYTVGPKPCPVCRARDGLLLSEIQVSV